MYSILSIYLRVYLSKGEMIFKSWPTPCPICDKVHTILHAFLKYLLCNIQNYVLQ